MPRSARFGSMIPCAHSELVLRVSRGSRDLLQGGGHTWPGGVQRVSAALVGPATESVDATRLVWSFFAGVGQNR